VFSKISISILFIGISFASIAQREKDIHVNGRFLVDSIKVGQQVPYSITVSYPENATILFPDSTYAFSPFEFVKKKYFQTKTTNSISYDSVVYYLTTFEIDSIQNLKLPVYEVHKQDCTAIYTENDALIFKNLVVQKLDSIEAPALPLKTNTTYQTVKWLLDYPLLLAVVGVLLVILLIVWIIFGKRIRTYFKIRKLSKNHEAFLTKFTTTVSQLNSDFSSKKTEAITLLWKNYMERLTNTPYTKFTSKEIILKEKDEQLATALQSVDRMIYGGSAYDSSSFESLRAFANNQYTHKLKEINRG
jgi:hypothetical protein